MQSSLDIDIYEVNETNLHTTTVRHDIHVSEISEVQL